jgi:hypothetical protein
MDDTQDNKILKLFLVSSFLVLIYFVAVYYYDSLKAYKKEVDFLEAKKMVYRSYVDYPEMNQKSQKLFKFLARGKDKDSVASVLSVWAMDTGVKVESIDFLDSFQADSSRIKIISDSANESVEDAVVDAEIFSIANLFVPAYQRMSVALNITGSYYNINVFLQKIENNSRYYDVQLFDYKGANLIKENSVNSEQGSANIVFNIYYQG